MTISTIRLLKLDPFSALLVLINQHYKLRLNPAEVQLKEVKSLSGKQVEVTVAASHPVRYTGELTVQYPRLDLAEVLGESLQVELAIPVSIADILRELTKATGIVFDRHDFAMGTAWTYPYRLIAHPASLRWVGEIDLYLKHPGDPIPLLDAITHTRCHGFTPV